MKGILASLPGSPAVCSLNCISRPGPQALPVYASTSAVPSSTEDVQTPGRRSHDDQPKTPAPHKEQMACSPISSSSEQLTPVQGVSHCQIAAPWLVVSRLEPGQPPIIMQIPVDDRNSLSSDQHVMPAASTSQVILGQMHARAASIDSF